MPRSSGTPGQTDDVALAITALHLQGARRMGTHLINQKWSCVRSVPSHPDRNIRHALPLPQGTRNVCDFHINLDSLMQLLFPHLLFLLFACNCNRKWDPSVGNAARGGERRWKEKVAVCTVEDMALLSFPVRARWSVHRLSERKGKNRTSKKGDIYHWPWSRSYYTA